MQYSKLYRQNMILYAENCPEQPYIIEQNQPEKVRPKKIIKKKEQSALTYRPKIIKSHRFSANLHDQFQFAQHGRELASLYKRIKNCKSLSQRKKDHNDPILYPSYFIREEKQSKDARIDGYFKQVVSKRAKKQKKVTQTSVAQGINFRQQDSFLAQQRFLQSEMILPNISNKYVVFEDLGQTGTMVDLPACRTTEILQHLSQKNIFKIQDILILKARMSHYYGQHLTNSAWRQVLLRLGLTKSRM